MRENPVGGRLYRFTEFRLCNQNPSKNHHPDRGARQAQIERSCDDFKVSSKAYSVSQRFRRKCKTLECIIPIAAGPGKCGSTRCINTTKTSAIENCP
jgi:hypothetical protein